MARAPSSTVTPALPSDGGAAPSFSAEIGAWRRPPIDTQRGRSGFRSGRPGNLTLSQRGKIWLAIILYCAGCWALIGWAVESVVQGGGL